MSRQHPSMLPDWAPVVLAIQLVLAFFAPPIVLGARSVFLPDLWCWAWLAAALATRPELWRRHWRFFAVTAALVAVIYLHGAARPSLATMFKESYYFMLSEPDTFQRGRELVIALRFLSWLWALRVVAGWFAGRASGLPRVLERTLLSCVALGAALTLGDRFVPGLRALLGRVYHFDPDFEYWVGRAYGPFRSPVEAGVALGLGLLLLMPYARRLPVRARGLLFFAVMTALAATKTITAFFAVAFAVALTEGIRHRRRLLKLVPDTILVPAASLVAGLFVAALAMTHLFNRLHLMDLQHRFNVWLDLAAVARSRPDLLFLGFGFAPYHTDGSYMFLFNRGGLVALGAFAAWILPALARGFSRWGREGRATVLFLLLCGLTLDSFIYRHVVFLMIAAGMPLLARETREAA